MEIILRPGYGRVGKLQWATYEKYGVSEFDHEMLCECLGEEERQDIIAAVKRYSTTGRYNGTAFLDDFYRATEIATTPKEPAGGP